MQYLSKFRTYDVLQVLRGDEWLDFATLRTLEDAVLAARTVDSCGQCLGKSAGPVAEYRIVEMASTKVKYPQPTLSLAFEVPRQVLKDLLTSAVEGGSNYWLCAREVLRDEQGDVISILEPADAEESDTSSQWPAPVKYTKLQHFPADYFRPGYEDGDIGLGAIARGLQAVLDGALPKRGDLIMNAARIPADDHDFDASDADVILQLGFFGEVIYG